MMSNISFSNFMVVIPELYLLTMSFVILIYGVFYKINDNNEKILFFNKISYLSVLILICLLGLIYSMGDIYVEAFNGLFVINPVIYIFKIIIVFFMLIIIVLSKRYLINIGIISFEYFTILLLFLLGNLLLVSSNDLMSFYLSLELATIASYILIFMNRYSPYSNEAGLKYFILGALGTGFLLYGLSLIYGFSGATNFIEIKKYLSSVNVNNWIVILGVIMVLVGIGFKLSLAPFHMWTIDVYKGSSTSVLMILSTIVKFSVMFVLLRLLFEAFFPLQNYWKQIIQLLIIISAFVGFIGAINQKSIKGFIAYSSIGNMAYLLMVALLNSTNYFVYFFIYIIIYGVSVIGFLGTTMLFKNKANELVNISDLKGLSKQSPYYAFVMSVFLLSMAGLPITSGFFAKALVLYAMIKANYYVLVLLVSFLTVAITYVYLRIIKNIYFDECEDCTLYLYSKKDNGILELTLFLLFTFTLGFILFLSPLLKFLTKSLVF
jgi:NADH-quinone oxidoreductase subunit N